MKSRMKGQAMDPKTQREFRFLKIYALVSSVLIAGLIFVAAKKAGTKARFEELDVERINIVEKDGTLRLAIANRDRSPGVVIGGKYFKSREGQRPGMIFFNDKGDECGGMGWEAEEKDGQVSAGGNLMFDQYNSDQTVGLSYSQRNGQRTSGLMVWERPLMSPEDTKYLQRLADLELMPEGPGKAAALKDWREGLVKRGLGGALRVFVGRQPDNQAVVRLQDSKGRTRALLTVDATDTPSLQFLDADGKIIYRIPAEGSK
jgi:hypothetical protein